MYNHNDYELDVPVTSFKDDAVHQSLYDLSSEHSGAMRDFEKNLMHLLRRHGSNCSSLHLAHRKDSTFEAYSKDLDEMMSGFFKQIAQCWDKHQRVLTKVKDRLVDESSHKHREMIHFERAQFAKKLDTLREAHEVQLRQRSIAARQSGMAAAAAAAAANANASNIKMQATLEDPLASDLERWAASSRARQRRRTIQVDSRQIPAEMLLTAWSASNPSTSEFDHRVGTELSQHANVEEELQPIRKHSQNDSAFIQRSSSANQLPFTVDENAFRAKHNMVPLEQNTTSSKKHNLTYQEQSQANGSNMVESTNLRSTVSDKHKPQHSQLDGMHMSPNNDVQQKRGSVQQTGTGINCNSPRPNEQDPLARAQDRFATQKVPVENNSKNFRRRSADVDLSSLNADEGTNMLQISLSDLRNELRNRKNEITSIKQLNESLQSQLDDAREQILRLSNQTEHKVSQAVKEKNALYLEVQQKFDAAEANVLSLRNEVVQLHQAHENSISLLSIRDEQARSLRYRIRWKNGVIYALRHTFKMSRLRMAHQQTEALKEQARTITEFLDDVSKYKAVQDAAVLELEQQQYLQNRGRRRSTGAIDVPLRLEEVKGKRLAATMWNDLMERHRKLFQPIQQMQFLTNSAVKTQSLWKSGSARTLNTQVVSNTTSELKFPAPVERVQILRPLNQDTSQTSTSETKSRSNRPSKHKFQVSVGTHHRAAHRRRTPRDGNMAEQPSHRVLRPMTAGATGRSQQLSEKIEFLVRQKTSRIPRVVSPTRIESPRNETHSWKLDHPIY